MDSSPKRETEAHILACQIEYNVAYTASLHCKISLQENVLPWNNNAEMCPLLVMHFSVIQRKYNDFDLTGIKPYSKVGTVMLLLHLGNFDCDSIANYAFAVF